MTSVFSDTEGVLQNAEARYRRASQRAEQAREERNTAVRKALAAGMRPIDIAHATGLTRGRITQIAATSPPE